MVQRMQANLAYREMGYSDRHTLGEHDWNAGCDGWPRCLPVEEPLMKRRYTITFETSLKERPDGRVVRAINSYPTAENLQVKTQDL